MSHVAEQRDRLQPWFSEIGAAAFRAGCFCHHPKRRPGLRGKNLQPSTSNLLPHSLSRNHALANHENAPACVGQASRLSPSKKFPLTSRCLPTRLENHASRRSFKVRDRRDACPTAWFRLTAARHTSKSWPRGWSASGAGGRWRTPSDPEFRAGCRAGACAPRS